MNDPRDQVYVVMAEEVILTQMATMGVGCYCVCDSIATARAILEKDTQAGDIHPGGYITSHAVQTEEMI